MPAVAQPYNELGHVETHPSVRHPLIGCSSADGEVRSSLIEPLRDDRDA
jgi:hypothetical protein